MFYVMAAALVLLSILAVCWWMDEMERRRLKRWETRREAQYEAMHAAEDGEAK